MADLTELQGEVLALRCYVAALMQALPLPSRLRIAPAFESRAALVRDQLDEAGSTGFARVAISLAPHPLSSLRADAPDRPSATPGDAP